jgi:ABC-type polysaccharide/polyol phosphate transport system ATPase subunit
MWALHDIDLGIDSGETVGVIGRNGSGKTTLLRLLAGVSAPTTGRLRVVGSTAPLIGVGVGFNPELTGRENVFVNGELLGLSSARLRERFDDIVDFAELEGFLDTPVKFYSSGMFLRLAFSVAIHVEPDVLLVDEVLAVGDLAFQLKCFDRMRELQQRGTTIMVVTHSMIMVRWMCQRAVVLHRGEKRFDGAVDDAIGEYHALMELGAGDDVSEAAAVTLELVDGLGQPQRRVLAGEPLRLRVHADFAVETGPVTIHLVVGHAQVPGVYDVTLPMATESAGGYGPGRPLDATVRLENRLLGGTFTATLHLEPAAGGPPLGSTTPLSFFVASDARPFGLADLGGDLVVAGRPVPLDGDGAYRAGQRA